MKTTIRIFLFSLFIFHFSFVFAQTGAAPASDFAFTETATAVTITGYNKTGGAVVIPERINNKPVTTIGQMAFMGKQLTAVTIPNTVTTIGNYAFCT
ncbi:MAG: leucine-rich repeat domain-containing protein, partial [Treponema sp.]|nr:leucine-rich repeat domain-containing protein [Treponema sp.]